jgi:hypothetical protein
MILLAVHRETLKLSDGGQVALDWLEDGCSANAPIVIILPGLTGDSQSHYIRCLVLSANRIKLRAVVFNYRGLGGMSLKVILERKTLEQNDDVHLLIQNNLLSRHQFFMCFFVLMCEPLKHFFLALHSAYHNVINPMNVLQLFYLFSIFPFSRSFREWVYFGY